MPAQTARLMAVLRLAYSLSTQALLCRVLEVGSVRDDYRPTRHIISNNSNWDTDSKKSCESPGTKTTEAHLRIRNGKDMKLSLFSFSFPDCQRVLHWKAGEWGHGLRVPACLKVKDMEQGLHVCTGHFGGTWWVTNRNRRERTAWRLCVSSVPGQKDSKGRAAWRCWHVQGSGSSDGGRADKGWLLWLRNCLCWEHQKIEQKCKATEDNGRQVFPVREVTYKHRKGKVRKNTASAGL